jgi:hypothetical protein
MATRSIETRRGDGPLGDVEMCNLEHFVLDPAEAWAKIQASRNELIDAERSMAAIMRGFGLDKTPAIKNTVTQSYANKSFARHEWHEDLWRFHLAG